MNVLSAVILLFFVGLVLAIFKASYSSSAGAVGLSPRSADGRKAKKSVTARSPYRATGIVQGQGACSAVKAIGGRRFLDTERLTPAIPLQAFDSRRCRCKYVHMEDRRQAEEDRRHPNMLRAELYDRTGEADRRIRKRGRRKTDWA
jgi:hypothetical protein